MTKKISAYILVTAALLGAVIIYRHPPGHNAWYPPCIFKKITGLDCPGCGSTRACYRLLHGEFYQAAGHNILLLIFLPAIFIGLITFFTGRWQRLWQWLNKPWVVLWMVLLFWLLRNIPVFPFEWLHSDK
jgi:Protein of unknown function (DUF2752)